MLARKRKSDIEDLLRSGRLMWGDDERLIIDRIGFGLPDLDKLSNGGVPRNRITILVGEYSSGKSFLVQLLIKHALASGQSAAYIDTERTFDPLWWKQVGVDVTKLYVAQPLTGEEATDLAAELAKQGLDVVAIDSLAGLVPSEVIDEGAAHKLIGAQARLINRLMHKVLAPGQQTAIVCTNQLRSNIGPGPIDTMPGGWGQQYFAHLILRVAREGWIEEQGRRVGFNMRIVCRKSKVGSPWGECLLPFLFRGEIDELSLLAQRAIEADIISQTGAWYTVFGETRVLGWNSLLAHLKEVRERVETALEGH